jgi:hypothetical protein
LGLVGDLDDVELVEDIETAFALRFEDDDLRECRTVGDLFAIIERSLPTSAVGGSCATSMCFYRLRRALRSRVDCDLRPDNPIECLKHISIRELYRVIESDCGLRPPTQIISIWGCVALLLIAALPLGCISLGWPWWLAAASALPAIVLYSFAPIRLPKNIITFGDLVRRVAARSIGSLSAKGARLRPPEAWAVLKDIVSDHTVLPKDEISRDTLLLGRAEAVS